MTPDLLQKVELIVLFVAGPEKARVVETIMTDPERVVAGRALRGNPRIELWYAAQD